MDTKTTPPLKSHVIPKTWSDLSEESRRSITRTNPSSDEEPSEGNQSLVKCCNRLNMIDAGQDYTNLRPQGKTRVNNSKDFQPVSKETIEYAFRFLRDKKLMDAYILLAEKDRTFKAIKCIIPKEERLLFVRICCDKQSANLLLYKVKTFRGIKPQGKYLDRVHGFEYLVTLLFPALSGEIASVVDSFRNIVESTEWLRDCLFSPSGVGFLVGIAQMARAKDAIDVGLAALQACNSLRDSGVGPYIMQYAMTMTGLKPQAGDESAEFLADYAKDAMHHIIDAPIACRLVGLVTAFLSTNMFRNLPQSSQIAVKLSLTMMQDVGRETSFAADVITYINLVLKSIVEFVKTGNPLALLGKQPRDLLAKRITDHYSECVKYRVKSGKLPRAPETLILEFNQIAKSVNEYLSKHRDMDIKSSFERLSLMISAMRVSGAPSRPVPPGFILCGPPGTGKTTLATDFGKVIAVKHGLDEVNTVFNFNLAAKYQAAPGCAWVLVCDEFFSRKDEYTQSVDYLMLLTMFANPTPLEFECARVEDKNIQVAPEVNFITTNASYFSFTTAVDQKDCLEKLDRRYQSIWTNYTPLARKLSIEMGMPLSMLIKHYDSPYGLVEYKVMRLNTHGNVVHFMPNMPDLLDGSQGPQPVLEKPLAPPEVEPETEPKIDFKLKHKKVEKLPFKNEVTPPAPVSIESFTVIATFSDVSTLYDWICSQIEVSQKRHDTLGVRGMCSFGHHILKDLEGKVVKHNHKCDQGVKPQGAAPSKPPVYECDLEEEESAPGEEELDPDQVEEADFCVKSGEWIMKMKMPTKRKVFSSWCDWWEWVDYGTAWGVSASSIVNSVSPEVKRGLQALIGWTLFAGILYTGVRSQMPQPQAIVRALDKPYERNYVHPATGHIATFLGVNARPIEIEIRREDGYKMYATPIAMNVFVTAAHFFTGMQGQQYMSKSIPIGNKFITVDYLGFEVEQRYDKNLVHFIGYDLAFFKVLNPVKGVRAYYDKVAGEAAELCWNNQMKRFSPWLAGDDSLIGLHESSSQDGDCGRPVITSSGDLYSIHIAVERVAPYRPISERIKPDYYNCVFGLLKAQGEPVFVKDKESHPILKYMDLRPGSHQRSALSNLKHYHPERVGSINQVIEVLGHQAYYRDNKMTGRPTKIYENYADLGKIMCVPYAGKAFRVEEEEQDFEGVSFYNAHVHRYLVISSHVPRTVMVDRRACELLTNLFPIPTTPLVPITFGQAVCGDIRNDFMVGKDTTKSIGPYMASMGISRTQAFAARGDGSYTVHPAIETEVNRIKSKLLAGKLPMPVFSATIKDEMISEGKFRKGRARLFYVGDVGYNMLIRMYFLPIIAYAFQYWKDTGFCGAINCSSPDWDFLAERLSRGNVFERDGQWFDLHHAEILEDAAYTAGRIATRLGYGSEDATIVVGLVLMLRECLVLQEGEVHVVNVGMCSGVSLTSFINAVVNILLTLHYLVSRDLDVSPFNRSIFVCGDDKVESFRFKVDGADMVASDREHGHVSVSAADKSKPPWALGGVHEAHFLKRGFVKWPDGRWRCPLEPDSIWKALKYVVGKMTPDEEVERNKQVVFQMAGEAYMHGEDFHRAFIERAKRWCDDVKFHTFSELNHLFLVDNLIPWDMRSDRPGLVFDQEAAAQSFQTRYQEQNSAFLKPQAMSGSVAFSFRSTELNTPMTTSVDEGNALVTLPTVVDNTTTGVPGALDKPVTPHPSTFEALMKQKQVVASFNLAAGYTVAGVTGQVINNNPRLLALSAGYLGYKYKIIRIHLSYVGLPTTFGAYSLSFVPTPGMTTSDSAYASAVWPTLAGAGLARLNLPHLVVDISKPCDCTIELPFLTPYDYMSFATVDWTIIVDTISTIGNTLGITQPACFMRIFADYEGFELAILKPQGKMKQEEVEGGQLSRAITYGQQLAKEASWYVSSFMELLKLGGAAAAIVGLSRPVVGVESIMSRLSFTGACASGGINTTASLAIDPIAGKSVSLALPSGALTNIKEMCARPGYKSLAVIDSVVFQVDPCNALVAGTTASFTPLSYAASFFRYYRGSVKVRLTWYSSPLTRGSVLIAIAPAGATASIATAHSASYIEAEIIGTTSVVFEMPYTNVAQLSTHAALFGNFIWAWTAAPRDNAGAALSIMPTMEVWSEDMVFEVPEMNLPNVSRAKILQPQGAYTGEVLEDLRLLAKRQCYHGIVSVPAANGFALPPDGFIGPAAIGATFTFTEWTLTFHQWLRLSHYCFTGGTVWTVRQVTDNATGSNPTSDVNYTVYESSGKLGYSTTFDNELQRSFGGYSYDDSSAGVTFQTIGDVRSFVVPDRSSLKYKIGAQGYTITPSTAQLTSVINVLPPYNSSASAHSVYCSAAEDFALGYFLGPPYLVWV